MSETPSGDHIKYSTHVSFSTIACGITYAAVNMHYDEVPLWLNCLMASIAVASLVTCEIECYPGRMRNAIYRYFKWN
jgi:hypothetical protein